MDTHVTFKKLVDRRQSKATTVVPGGLILVFLLAALLWGSVYPARAQEGSPKPAASTTPEPERLPADSSGPLPGLSPEVSPTLTATLSISESTPVPASLLDPELATAGVPPADMFQLPWNINERWQVTQGPHEKGEWSGLDMNPRKLSWNDPNKYWVVAAADGQITDVSSCYVAINHRDGWGTGYVHLHVTITRAGTDGKGGIKRNEPIGYLETNQSKAQCGGRADGPHLHFRLLKNNAKYSLIGATFGGWRVEVESGYLNDPAHHASLYIKGNVTKRIYELLDNSFGTAVPCPPTFSGWKGEYWNNPTLSGTPALCRNDERVSFYWGTGSPANEIASDGFSARWSRRISFPAGLYTFVALADDGIKVWLDSDLILNAWRDQGPTEYRVTRRLSAGEHEIRIEYYENGGVATAQFSWEDVSTCSNQFRAEYFNNISLSGSSTFERCENWPLTWNWDTGRPDGGMGSDNFSVVWTGQPWINAGTYTFIAVADDGIRVWLDGEKIIDAWQEQGATEYRATRSIGSGNHNIRIEYFEKGGKAVAKFRWETAEDCSNQYRALYFNNLSLSGTPVMNRCESWPLVQNWRAGSPGGGVGNDNFSVVWSGRPFINAGTYTFIARADDGIQVWLDGQKIIDAWYDQGATTYFVSRTLGSGYHEIMLKYYERGGEAVVQFRWEPAAGSHYNRLSARHSGRCMDVTGGSRNSGTAVIQWDCHTGDNQMWNFVPAGDEYYRLVARHSGKCLDVYGASPNNGARLIQWDCNGGNNQLFRKEDLGRGNFRLRARHSNRCIDVYGGWTGNGVPLIQWDCNGGNNQSWQPQPLTALRSKADLTQADHVTPAPEVPATEAAAEEDPFPYPFATEPPLPESANPFGEYVLPLDATGTTLIEHTVYSGDTLAAIAEVYQITPEAILAANAGLDPDTLQAGQTIYVPVSVPASEIPPVPEGRLYLPFLNH